MLLATVVGAHRQSGVAARVGVLGGALHHAARRTSGIESMVTRTGSDPVLRGGALGARFDALSEFLQDRRYAWGPRPYLDAEIDWERVEPALSRWCRTRSSEQLEASEGRPWSLAGAPEPALDWSERARELCRVGHFAGAALPESCGVGHGRGIRGRKWAQVRALAATLAPRVRDGQTLVDWCAGKGHLGRTMAHATGADVVLVEQQRGLCDAGAARAREEGLNLRFVAADALGATARRELRAGRFVVALHACGALGGDLVERAVAGEVDALALAPCCHHRISGGDYRPASRAAHAVDLPLTRSDLKLATTEQAHASPAIARARVRGMEWRLGLDLAVIEATGADPRTRIPYLHARQIKVPFRAFCEGMAGRHGLALPRGWDAERTLAAARDRVRMMRGLYLVRWIFRRPLELWLVLDRALRLEEAGYSVEVGVFCARGVTARNLVLVARRAVGSPGALVGPPLLSPDSASAAEGWIGC